MADDFKDDLDRLLNRPFAECGDEEFLRQVEQRIRWARRSRIVRAAILTLVLVLSLGAAFFVTLAFLRMAGSEILEDNPTVAVAFWFPYGVVAVTLALFLRTVIEQAFRHFLK